MLTLRKFLERSEQVEGSVELCFWEHDGMGYVAQSIGLDTFCNITCYRVSFYKKGERLLPPILAEITVVPDTTMEQVYGGLIAQEKVNKFAARLAADTHLQGGEP